MCRKSAETRAGHTKYCRRIAFETTVYRLPSLNAAGFTGAYSHTANALLCLGFMLPAGQCNGV
jgi:hypothetical protein